MANSFFSRARGWYAKFERPFSSLSLIGGFVFDAITLKRVDLFWENFWVIAHLGIVTVCAVIINLIDNTEGNETNPAKLHFWLVNVMQFFFGGILSTYLVFYFRSASLGVSWPFLVVLALAFIANERLKRHYARLAFQIALLFLAFYSFAIYLMPILLHEIGARVFLLSGLASLVAIGILILVLAIFSRERFAGRTGRAVIVIVVGIFAGMNLLYFYKLIPPLPLSLKDAGIYQTLTVQNPGHYTVQYEDQGPLGFLNWYPTVHITSGDALYAYTAVFSPTALDINVIHQWQYYDATKGAWVTRGRISLPVTGGNDGGWRTFSLVSGITPGLWRVNVTTPDGSVIGQLRFNVVVQDVEPTLTTQTI